MSLWRICLSRLSRRLVLTRRLPPRFGVRRLRVSPGAALAYFHPLTEARWRDLFDFAWHGVGPGECVWDIGANLGVFAFAAAHRAGPTGEVLAIEPDPWLADLMRQSAQQTAPLAAPVHILSCAVSDGIGVESFSTPSLARSGSHLTAVAGAGKALVGETAALNPVITVHLDWLLERRRKPDAIKIDVEGAELAVLQGARILLRNHRPRLLIEVYERSADAITALLHEEGYALFDFSSGWPGSPVTRAVYQTLALPRHTP